MTTLSLLAGTTVFSSIQKLRGFVYDTYMYLFSTKSYLPWFIIALDPKQNKTHLVEVHIY